MCLTRLLHHDELLIAKLPANGLDMSRLKPIYFSLTKRKQRIKTNYVYSSWTKILFGVLQGSLLGPLLFNIFLCSLFIILPNFDIANYADDFFLAVAFNILSTLLSTKNFGENIFGGKYFIVIFVNYSVIFGEVKK